jgi:prepilin-type N-terminal cleavage/methylation domain-containing protein
MNLTKIRGRKIRGFSLLEVSVVILIIGIFIAGSFAALALIKKSRIQTAQVLSKSAPMHGIAETALWLESSLDSSFVDNQQKDGEAITAWNDQKSTSNKVVVSVVGNGPTYSNTINYVHAVKFSESSADHLRIYEAGFLNNTDYTIVVLEKRQSGISDNYFIGSPSTNPNDNLLLGYSNDSTVIHKQGSNAYATKDSAVSAYADSANKPRLFTFISDSVEGKKTYINGVLAAQDPTNTAKLSGITSLEIGKGYAGEIGEIVIFTKPLRSEDRKAVEDYIAKKWTRPINRGVESCTNGIVTESGCNQACATSVVTGVVSPTTVNDGASGSLNCTDTGYTGTVTYSCSGGNLNPSATVCDCASGFAPSGGLCVASCSFSGVAGIVDGTSVFGPSGVQSCNAANFNDSINYTCSGTTANISAGSCDTCVSGYAFVGGVCQQQCLFTGATGIVDGTTVNGPSGTRTCNASNFNTSDSVNYTCSGTTANISSGACDTCAAGYSFVGGECLQNCSFTGVTGIVDGTSALPPSGTQACNATNFNDSINYTCSGATASVSSGACDQCDLGYVFSGGSCVLGPLDCTGGNGSPTITGGRKIHYFTSNGTLTCAGAANSAVKILLVGGGGSGGGGGSVSVPGGGGGGGGGQVLEYSSQTLAGGNSLTVVVGNGGAAVTGSVAGNIGQPSSVTGALTFTALGGGGGGRRAGGSSTGSSSAPGGGAGTGGTVAAGSYSGGTGGTNGSQHGGSGGSSAQSPTGIRGAKGVTSTITGLVYGGGGGGGSRSGLGSQRLGGSGGGGGGAYGNSSSPVQIISPSTAGSPNTGGGGGGSMVGDSGSAGGSGIVVISYPEP